jgi:hypothetical protein
MAHGAINDPAIRADMMASELEMIQRVIARMAQNSFYLKGWCLTVVVGTLALGQDPLVAALALPAIVLFWALDAYYLRLERAYRCLHRWVAENRLSSEAELFALNASRFLDNRGAPIRTMGSYSLIWFYGIMSLLCIAFLLVSTLKIGGGS